MYDSWTHPFINLPVLQLNKSGTDGSNVTLLIGEGYSPRPFRILELGVSVNAGVAHTPIQTVHDHGQLHCNRKPAGLCWCWSKLRQATDCEAPGGRSLAKKHIQTCTQGSRDASDKDGLPWIQRL